MKRLVLHKILIIILLVGYAPMLFGQKSDSQSLDNNKWFLGINGGVNVFWGDIKFNSFWPSPEMQELQAGGSIIFGRKLNNVLRLNAELSFTSLKGMQEVYPDTLGFKTQGLSFALKGQFNPVALWSKKQRKLAFYIESGVGIMAWRNLVQNHNTNDTLNNLGWTNPNKEIGFYIPAGIKIEYQISPKISTYFSSNYTIVFSDLLDGEAIGNFDSYSYTALGINYYFGKQKMVPKLLPYSYFEIAYDSLAIRASSKKKKSQDKKLNKIPQNPFSLSFIIPETAPHSGFDIQIVIEKTGIPSTGFFRLLVPSGFLPQATINKDVSFTKLGHRYEYDFILPMNQDSTSIPIHLELSEIEKGTFPILIEGEIMDQEGNIFPIKSANYTEIISEDTWYKGLAIKEQQKFDAKKTKEELPKALFIENKEKIKQEEEIQPTISKAKASSEQIKSTSGIYRIQIMASRKQIADLNTFKAKHRINQDLFVSQAEGWYRYTLFSTIDPNEAYRLCAKVRSDNKLPQAFVTFYKNGKRTPLPSSKKVKGQSYSSTKTATKKKTTTQATSKQAPINGQFANNKLLYRIEIAMAYDQPIPLYLFQNKVGKEPIIEFAHNQNYYYTVGEFENLAVARAFLDYVKTQFNFETAKIGLYRKNERLKGIL